MTSSTSHKAIQTAILLVSLMFGGHAFAGKSQPCNNGKKADIVATAVAAGNFTTLVAAVQAAGLVETLKSEGPFTVFAPTDEAFAQLPPGTIEFLLENKDVLTKVLLYHVAPGAARSDVVLGLSEVQTVLGQTVKISLREDGLYLNESKVIVTDIEASNGIIHVIDAVLMPQL